MKKIEIFALWVCLLGIFLLTLGLGGIGWGVIAGLIVFFIGSVMLLNSLWDRRKDK